MESEPRTEALLQVAMAVRDGQFRFMVEPSEDLQGLFTLAQMQLLYGHLDRFLL